MSTTIYRVQDAEGRGPWRPGFSKYWVCDRDDHDVLIPWMKECALRFGAEPIPLYEAVST